MFKRGEGKGYVLGEGKKGDGRREKGDGRREAGERETGDGRREAGGGRREKTMRRPFAGSLDFRGPVVSLLNEALKSTGF